MWLTLREGINVIKHGRKGKPSNKTLFCDYYMTKLYWRNPGSKLDKDDQDLNIELIHSGSGYTSTTFNSDPDFLNDTFPFSRTKTNESRRKSSFFGAGNRRSSLTKADSERVLYLKDIVQVTSDCSSEVLQRASAKNYVGADGYSILSIIAIGRSLDLEVEQVCM